MSTLITEPPRRTRVDAVTVASYLLTAAVLYLSLALHLFAGVLAGLLVYTLVHLLAPMLERRLVGERARLIALATLAVVTIVALISLTMATIAFFRSDTGNLQTLADKTQHILDDARAKLPASVVENLPDTTGELHEAVRVWAEEHRKELGIYGKDASHLFLHTLIGMIVGALLSLREQRPHHRPKPLAAAIGERASRLVDAFQRIIFAQFRISLLNTAFSGVFLLGALPLCGIHLPFAKTLVALTFFTGLLPVVGNLISNSVVTIVAMSVSLNAGIAALVFLVVIHKLEYFLNAKIVGSRINARAWELLVVMFAMEAAFGIAGLIAAPIFYAYVKSELAARDLI